MHWPSTEAVIPAKAGIHLTPVGVQVMLYVLASLLLGRWIPDHTRYAHCPG